jgi:hypothetical protein
MHGSNYKLNIAEAVREAFGDLKPKSSPSGFHATYVIGQLVVNFQGDTNLSEPIVGKSECCRRCDK